MQQKEEREYAIIVMHKQQKQRLLSSNRKLSVLTLGTPLCSWQLSFPCCRSGRALFQAMWLSVPPLGTRSVSGNVAFPVPVMQRIDWKKKMLTTLCNYIMIT
jgi:hypothetical protein